MTVMSTQMIRIGTQYPACRFNDVLSPVKSEKSLLRSTLRVGGLSIMPELEPPFIDETEAIKAQGREEEKENGIMLTMGETQAGKGTLDLVRAGLSAAASFVPKALLAAAAVKGAVSLASGPIGTKLSNVLSEKFNNNPEWKPGFSGEKHLILPTKFGLTRANFAGPQTNLRARLARGDKGVDGPNGIDRASKIHDILYSLARTETDIRKADERLIRDINNSSQGPKTKKLAVAMVKGKIFGENVGVFGPETFTDLPGLRGSGPTKRSDTGVVGLDNSLTGTISGRGSDTMHRGTGSHQLQLGAGSDTMHRGAGMNGGQIGGPPTVALGMNKVGSMGEMHLMSDLDRSSSLHRSMIGAGVDQNMFFRGVLGDFVTPQIGPLHGNYKHGYDSNLHNFMKQTGRGSHQLQLGAGDHITFNPSGGGIHTMHRGAGIESIKEIKELAKSGVSLVGKQLQSVIESIPNLPGDRLKSELLKEVSKIKKVVKKQIGKGGKAMINDDELFDKSQKGGQLGILASLAASFIIPLIIKKIRGKGQSGTGKLTKAELNKLLGSILGRKVSMHGGQAQLIPLALGAAGLLPLIAVGIEKLRKSGKLGKLQQQAALSRKQKGGQLGILAGLAASILLPEIIKKIRGK